MGNKFFIRISVLFFFASSSAHAGVLQHCAAILVYAQDEAPSPQAHHPSENSDYRKFREEYRANPKLLPPTAPITRDTTEDELQKSVYYWWYPHNAYERILKPSFRKLAEHVIMGKDVPPNLIPTLEQRRAHMEALKKRPLIAPRVVYVDQPVNADLSPPAPAEENEMQTESALDTSPTKDSATGGIINNNPATEHAPPPASQPGSGFSDSGAGPGGAP